MTVLSRTLLLSFSAVALVVPEDADIRSLNGCDVWNAKNIAYACVPLVPDVVIIDDDEKCKSVSSTAAIKRILRCCASTVVFQKQLPWQPVFDFAEHPQPKAMKKRARDFFSVSRSCCRDRYLTGYTCKKSKRKFLLIVRQCRSDIRHYIRWNGFRMLFIG